MTPPNKFKQWMLALAGFVSMPLALFLALINPFAKEGDYYGLNRIFDALAITSIVHIISIITLITLIVLIKVNAEDKKLTIPLKIGFLYYTAITIIAFNEPIFPIIFDSIKELFKFS